MVPFYFGSSEVPLFGLYHPAVNASAGRGVIIANPLGHEYLPAYPALRTLAGRLSQAGLHVLRFDYSGTGDSAGEAGEGSVDGWVDELLLAVDELRAMANVQDVCVVGLRLGATLAISAAQKAGCFSQLVLWEPVLRGREYLDELKDLQEKYIRETVPKPREAARLGPAHEIMGYAIGADLLRGLAEIDLGRGEAPSARCLALSKEAPAVSALAGCRHVAYRGPEVWVKDSAVEEAPVPMDTIEEIVGYVVS